MLIVRTVFTACVFIACGAIFFPSAAKAQNLAFEGFETNTGDWTPITTRVPSGGGTLQIPAASGNWYGELTNVHDSYSVGYGGAEFSYFGFPSTPSYTGDYSQSISLYVFADWPTAINNGPGVWVDMSGGHLAGNFGAEHNFHLTPTGSSVIVTADGQVNPIVTITKTGWYTFQMTFKKGKLPTDLVSTDMNVRDHNGNLLGTTLVVSDSPSGPLLSQDLKGPGYVWITVWPNGFANDVMAIDGVRADLLTPGDAYQVRYAANLNIGDSQISLTNTGASGGNLCANVYAFDSAEELIACCTCTVTPNGLQGLSVRDGVSNTLTPAMPTSVVIKIVATSGMCNASAVTAGVLAPGLRAWVTTLHQNTSTTPITYSSAEGSFAISDLSAPELAHMTSTCGFIQSNGSGFGICKGCSAGGR